MSGSEVKHSELHMLLACSQDNTTNTFFRVVLYPQYTYYAQAVLLQ